MLNFLAKMEPAKLATIIFASVFAVVFIVCLIIAFIAKRGKEPYDKDGFVHKVLKHDYSIFYQLASFAQTILFIGAIVVYFVNFKYHFYVCAVLVGILLLVALAVLVARVKTTYCRIEYNRNGLYKVGMFNTSKEIAWKDLKDVKARGIGKNRVFTFIAKKGTKIKVPFTMVGSYEFMVFCEKQLEGKNFEAIRIGKARQ